MIKPILQSRALQKATNCQPVAVRLQRGEKKISVRREKKWKKLYLQMKDTEKLLGGIVTTGMKRARQNEMLTMPRRKVQ